jgi:RecA/RadA recombinase
MSTFLNPYRIIPIQNSDHFEVFCCEVARDWFSDFAAQRYGCSGQRQDGIDIITTSREITATNTRGGYQKVVIQCKYKEDPKNFKINDAIRELKQDLESAIAAHQFDVFIYASTLKKRNTKLKKMADELALTHNKEVMLWFWDDLELAVSIHPRLQRMYAEGSISSGVQLLHPDFLKSLENRQADPFQFYTAKVAGDWQWLGVLHGLAAQRNCRQAIDNMLDTLFARPHLDTKIAAVVYGEGGSGKSTLLRQIAVDRAKQGYNCWWVENMDSFINHDAKSISENSHLRHLVFVEDWYRNMKDKSGTEFFTWLNDQRNVLVLIGDRNFQSSVYGSYCYHNSKYQLLPGENRSVLEHIAKVSEDYRPILNELGAQHTLLDHATLFMILFVAATMLKERDKHVDIDFNDGVLTAFQKIIANKLLVLEKDEHHHGLGKALYLLASIYASGKMGYTIFPEDFFLKTAACLGKNADLIERIKMNNYPDEVNAFIYKRSVVTKRHGALHFIEFNQDVLAEQGIAYVHEHKEELAKALSFDNYSLTTLLETITSKVNPDGAILLWLWLHTERGLAVDELAMQRLLYIFDEGLAQFTNYVLFKMVLATLPRNDLRIHYFILKQPLFFKLHEQIVCTVIKKVGADAAKTAAGTILAQDKFFSELPSSIVITALNKAEAKLARKAAELILAQKKFYSKLPDNVVSKALNKVDVDVAKSVAEKILAIEDFLSTLHSMTISTALNKAGADAARKAAKKILTLDKFFSELPSSIVSTALNKTGTDVAKTAAETILTQEKFFSELPFGIVITALNKAGANAAKTAAEQILAQEKFFSELPYQIVSTALNKAGAELAKTAAETILTQEKFFSELPFDIVSSALNKAGANAAKTAAETILTQKDFFKLPDSIVSSALNKAGADAAKTAAKTILTQKDFFKLPDSIVSSALNKAGANAAKTAAEQILAQEKFFSELPYQIVSTALNKAGAELAKTAAEQILAQEKFFSKLPFPIVSTALQILESEETAYQAARTILINLTLINTFLIFQAIKTLLQSNKKEDRGLIHAVADEINQNLRSKSKGFNKLYFDLLYLPLFEIPSHLEKVRRAFSGYRPTAQRLTKYNAYQILNCYYEYPGISYFQDEVKALSERILSDCIADVEYQRKEHPHETTFGHIIYALQHPALSAEADQAKELLLAYGQEYPDFQQSGLYKKVAGIEIGFEKGERRIKVVHHLTL